MNNVVSPRSLKIHVVLMKGLFASVVSAGIWTSAHAQEDLLEILDDSKANSPQVIPQANPQRDQLMRVLGAVNGDQQIFANHFLSGDFKAALLTYKDAFQNTSFYTSPNGRALYAYLLMRNGLRLKGLEALTSIGTPKEVSDFIVNLWRPLIDTKSFEWRTMEREISTDWALRLNVPTLSADAQKWREAIQLGIAGQADKAAKLLSDLLRTKSPVINADLLNITAARLLYQNGYLDAAIRYDLKVQRGSDYWYDAQEEAAWAHLRKGETQKALAITKSLTHPALALEVGPETVFLHALSHLKVCNYPEVANTLLEFKKRFRPKIIALNELLQETGADTLNRLLDLASQQPLTTLRLGALASRLPRMTGRDRVLVERGLRYGRLMAEAKMAGEIYSQSLQKGAQIGFQASFEKLRTELEERAQSTKGAFINRVQDLARAEIKEIGEMLQKMHIVEAELIQQTGLAERVARDTKGDRANVAKSDISLAKNEIAFKGDNEVWFDEINHYNFDVRSGCQVK